MQAAQRGAQRGDLPRLRGWVPLQPRIVRSGLEQLSDGDISGAKSVYGMPPRCMPPRCLQDFQATFTAIPRSHFVSPAIWWRIGKLIEAPRCCRPLGPGGGRPSSASFDDFRTPRASLSSSGSLALRRTMEGQTTNMRLQVLRQS